VIRSLATVCLLLAALPVVALADSALERGEALYERCQACHSLERNRTGPKHCGLIGRRAGSLPGIEYSPAMRGWGIVWTRENLDRFLADPPGTLPGTTMGYAGIEDAGERADLIAYLAAAGKSELCR
jgi:cytochrome c